MFPLYLDMVFLVTFIHMNLSEKFSEITHTIIAAIHLMSSLLYAQNGLFDMNGTGDPIFGMIISQLQPD